MGNEPSCFRNASHESKNDIYRSSTIKKNPNENNLEQLKKNGNDEGEIRRGNTDKERSTRRTKNKTHSVQAARKNLSYLFNSRPKHRHGTGPKPSAPTKSSSSKVKPQISLQKSEPSSNLKIPNPPPIPKQPINYKKEKSIQQTILPSNSQNKETSLIQKPPSSNILDLANDPKQKKLKFFGNVSQNMLIGKNRRPSIKESGAQTQHTLKSDLKQLDKWSIPTPAITPTSPLDSTKTMEPLSSPEIIKLQPPLNTQDPVLPAIIIPKPGPKLKSPNQSSPTINTSKAGPNFESAKAPHPPLSPLKPQQYPIQSQPRQQPLKRDTHSALQKPQNEAFAELKLGPSNPEVSLPRNIHHSEQPLQQVFPKPKQVPEAFQTNVRIPVSAQNAQSDPLPLGVEKSNTPKPFTQSKISLPASGSENLETNPSLSSNQVLPPTILNSLTFKNSAHAAPPSYIPEQRPPVPFPKPEQPKFQKPRETPNNITRSPGEPVNNFQNLQKPLITPKIEGSSQLDPPHDISKPGQPKNAPKWDPTPSKIIPVPALQQQQRLNQENNYLRKSEEPQRPELDPPPPPIPISKPPAIITRPLAPYNAQKPQSSYNAFRPPPAGTYKSVSPPTNFQKPKSPLDETIKLKPSLPVATNSDTVPLLKQKPTTHIILEKQSTPVLISKKVPTKNDQVLKPQEKLEPSIQTIPKDSFYPLPNENTMALIQDEFQNSMDFSLKKYKDIMSKLIDTKQPFTESQLTKYHEYNKKIILAAFREALTPVLDLKHENVKNLFEEQYKKLEKSIKSQLLIFTRKHEIAIEKVTTMIKDCTMEADMEYADLVEQFEFNDGNSKENMFPQHHNACAEKAVVKFDELVINKGLEVADFWKIELIHKMEETKEELILEKFGNKKMKTGD